MPDLGWDRALLTENSVQYSVADVMTDYGIKSINDYIGVQKAVLKKLTEDGFFADGNNVVVNQESGMTVAITKDGIRETLGKGSRFETLPSKLKKLKIATIQQIPELIKSATVRMNNVANYHNPSSDLKYVHLTSMAKIDNKEYEVEIIVRGSREKNKFWMHKILLEAKKEESGLSLRDDQERSHTEVNKTRIPYDNVSQSAENVKRENENLTTIRNLNEDDLAAMYGSARIPVQELLANTEGAGDVSLIVKNEDTRNNNAHLENMAAVIPSSVDWWLVERLKMNGLNVVEYRAGNEQARQEAETEAEKLLEPKKRFSLSPEEKAQRAQERAETAAAKAEEAKQAAQESYKRELTGGLKKLFEVQSYDNEALGKLLEAPMAEMQQGVKLLKAEKDDLFEALMNIGTATLPADD